MVVLISIKKFIAITVGVVMVLPMLAVRNFFVPVFVIWFLINLLKDIERTGRLYPYKFEKKIASWVGNSWIMMMLTFLLWYCGVLG